VKRISRPPPGLARAAYVIHSTLDRRPSLGELAAAAGLHPLHFHRIFKRHYGETAHQMSDRLRLERGKKELRRGVPLAEVAVATGYCSPSHFGSRFKRRFGITPAAWQRDAGARPPRGNGKRPASEKPTVPRTEGGAVECGRG
jgi:AraC-like DNA-binding protein